MRKVLLRAFVWCIVLSLFVPSAIFAEQIADNDEDAFDAFEEYQILFHTTNVEDPLIDEYWQIIVMEQGEQCTFQHVVRHGEHYMNVDDPFYSAVFSNLKTSFTNGELIYLDDFYCLAYKPAPCVFNYLDEAIKRQEETIQRAYDKLNRLYESGGKQESIKKQKIKIENEEKELQELRNPQQPYGWEDIYSLGINYLITTTINPALQETIFYRRDGVAAITFEKEPNDSLVLALHHRNGKRESFPVLNTHSHYSGWFDTRSTRIYEDWISQFYSGTLPADIILTEDYLRLLPMGLPNAVYWEIAADFQVRAAEFGVYYQGKKYLPLELQE